MVRDSNHGTILISVKEGVKPDEVISVIVPTMSVKCQRVIDIGPEVEKFKAENASTTLELLDEEEIFSQVYDKMSCEEKKLYRIYKINVENEETAKALLCEYEKSEHIEFAQLDYLHELCMQPNDPYYPQLYGLAKIESSSAWEISQGNDIIVAVVDTGVNYRHPDIIDNMWKDANGKYGRDFSSGTDDPNDYHGHGTHVAGTIAAVGNNNIGVVGVAPKAKIMPVKVFPNAYDSVIVPALKYAVDNGARVLNNSWGPSGRHDSFPAIEAAIDYVYSKGGIAVFAAGNNNDDVKYYSPANYSKTIAVAATDSNDNRASFSNYGDLVDIAAPGVNILSLSMYNDYVQMSGTSMACPHTSGLVAQILKNNPSLTFEQVRNIIKEGADWINTDKPVGAGRINAFGTLKTKNTMFVSNAIRNADGRITVFATGSDNSLWYMIQVAPNGGWGSWTNLGGRITSNPVAVKNANGNISVFAKGVDNSLWHISQTISSSGVTSWGNWSYLGGTIISEPAAILGQDGRIVVFVRWQDNTLWYISQASPNGSWGSWAGLGGAMISKPVTAKNADGRIEVFGRGINNALFHIWQTSLNGLWSNWGGLGGRMASDPSIVNNADGLLEVFARGLDNTLCHICQTSPNGSWSNWEGLGGRIVSNTIAVNNADGRIAVFADGTDSSLQYIWQTAPNNSWSAWGYLGGLVTSNPIVINNADGRIEVFTTGVENEPNHIWQTAPNNGWSNWSRLY